MFDFEMFTEIQISKIKTITFTSPECNNSNNTRNAAIVTHRYQRAVLRDDPLRALFHNVDLGGVKLDINHAAVAQAELLERLFDGAGRVFASSVQVDALLLQRHAMLGKYLLLQLAHSGRRGQAADAPHRRGASHADDEGRHRSHFRVFEKILGHSRSIKCDTLNHQNSN